MTSGQPPSVVGGTSMSTMWAPFAPNRPAWTVRPVWSAMLSRIALLTLALLALAWASSDTPRLSLVRPPAFLAEGYAVPFRLRVPPDPDNRSLSLAAYDTEDGERVAYSQRDVDGHSAALQVFNLLLPSGDLLIVGQLWGVPGQIAKVQTPVQVQSKLGQD